VSSSSPPGGLDRFAGMRIGEALFRPRRATLEPKLRDWAGDTGDPPYAFRSQGVASIARRPRASQRGDGRFCCAHSKPRTASDLGRRS